MAERSATQVVIRVKRKRDEPAPEDLVIERREAKRRNVLEAMSGLRVTPGEDSAGQEEGESATVGNGPAKERFQRLTSTTFLALQQQMPPDTLAALLPTLRFESMDAEGVDRENGSQIRSNTAFPSLDSKKFTVYDFALDQLCAGTRACRPLLPSLPGDVWGQEEGEEGGGEDGEPDVVFDLYFKAAGDGSAEDDSDWQAAAPVLQLIDDNGNIWEVDPDDSQADSQDSNAEGYYANSYPDEDTESSSSAGSNDWRSNADSWERRGEEWW